jgi:AAA+ superfamily predicted ATPase
MTEINSFARPVAMPQKGQLKSPLAPQKTAPVAAGTGVFHNAGISDSVHFAGAKRSRGEGKIAPKTLAAPDSDTGSDGDMPPLPPPPPRPRGRQPMDNFFQLLAGPMNDTPPINPGQEMAKHIKPFHAEDSEWEAYKEVGAPYADKLAEISSRFHLNNAVLRADDPQVQQSILMKLKEKLGLTPMFSVDCAPENLEALQDHYQGPALANALAEPAHTLGLPLAHPTVLFLKDADAEEAESLQKKEAFQRIKNNNPHFCFIIGQPSKTAATGAENALQIMLGGAKAKSTDTRPAPFETVNVKPLNTEQWSHILLHDKQTRQILNHWKLDIPKETLLAFLNTLQRGQSAPLEREYILGEMDSLASFIRVRQKDQSGHITPFHVIEYAKTLNLPSQALVKVPAGLSSNPLEQKPYKIVEAKDIKTRLDDVVGHKRAKEVLSQALEAIKYPALYAHLNEGDEDAQNNHVLLMGEPGGGKTMLAKAVAGEGKGTFISSSGSQFVNVYVGMGANNMRQLKSAIENVSSDLAVVFIDEIDSLGSRDKGAGGAGGREESQTINEFLALTEGIGQNKKKILLIGATNRPEALDSAILSRFHHKIGVDKLDGNQRKLLLTKQMQQKKLTPDSSVDMGELVKLTEGFSGRDLRNILKLGKQALIQKMPVAEKEKLEKNPGARKQFQLNMSQEVLLNAIAEIKKGWQNANKDVVETPPPFGMYT